MLEHERAVRLSGDEVEVIAAGLMRILQAAAADEFIGSRLASAQTTLQVHTVDTEPEVVHTFLLDREPIEVHEGAHGDAEVHLYGDLADVIRFYAGEFHLGVGIMRGQLRYTGPIRKVLRVVPILRRIVGQEAMHLLEGDDPATVRPLVERLLDTGEQQEPLADLPELGDIDDGTTSLLEQAAEYQEQYGDVHEGALQHEEERPGDFWSIRINDVHKSFGRSHILRGLDLGIPEGMITLILGPSGTGKSVLINHLIGLMFPDQGDVVVHGDSLSDMTQSRLLELRQKYGILFQDGALFGSMSVYDNVAFPLREHTDLSEAEIAEIVNARLADVGLTAAADRMPSALSGGMKKRAGFARALVLEPEIVMFDEPDSGLDPVRTALLGELIKKMHKEHGGTYIVITHDIASVRQIGEYIAVLWEGKIVQSGEAGDMLRSDNPFVRQFLNRGLVGPLGME